MSEAGGPSGGASYGARLAGFWRENRLFTVLLELTYRCNLDCFFCYNDLGLAGRPLTLDQYRDLLDDLAEMGALHVALSGGEPLAHPDFFAIGGHARERGFVVRLKSNGHALRGALARRLRDEVDPFLIEISLHGARAETHDRQTRIDGSFERLMSNLDELRELGFRLQLNSTLTAWNQDELEGMFAIADRFGVPFQVDPEVTPRDDGDRSPLAIAPPRAAIRKLFELQAERLASAPEGVAPVRVEKQGDEPDAPIQTGKHCGAGSSHLTVDPFGNVYPCVQWRRPVGNVHDRRVAEIWRGSSELEEIRRIEGVVHERIGALGADGRDTAFCPGLAEQTTGDATLLYEAAEERLELRRGVRAGGGKPLLPILP